MHSSLDVIFNSIEPEELSVEKTQGRKYNHFIYLMEGWRVLDHNDLTPYVRKLRRIMEMFPDIAYYPTNDLREVDIELNRLGDVGPLYFPDGCDSVCAFSFINPNTRSMMRLYETIQKVAVEVESQDNYMFLDSGSFSNKIDRDFIYSERKDIQRMIALFDNMEQYASSPAELIKIQTTRDNLKVTMLDNGINAALESEIAAGNLEDGVIEWLLKNNKTIKLSEIKDVRGFANGKVPCDGDMPHEAWDALPSRFVKTAFAVIDMNKMRHPETIALQVPEMSREWVKNCSSEIKDSRVFKDTNGDIVILYSLKVICDDNVVRIYLMSKLYTSHKKFSYDEAHRYFKLLLNDEHILDSVLYGRTTG